MSLVVPVCARHTAAASEQRARRPRRLTVLAALVTVVAAACGWPNLEPQSDALAERIRELPGVRDVQVNYDTSFDGGAYFLLTTDFERNVDTAAAQRVVRTFVDGIHADDDFDQFHVELTLTYPAAPTTLTTKGADGSALRLAFGTSAEGADPTPDAAAGTAAVWLDAARSPAVASVGRPKLGPGSWRIELRKPVDDRAAMALLRSHPELSDAAWVYGLAESPSAEHARTYTSVGVLPDAPTRAIWTDVVARVGPVGNAEAITQRVAGTANLVTDVRIELPTGYGYEGVERVAPAVAALLTRFGHPVQLDVGGDQRVDVTVGGCSRPGNAGRVVSPLQAKLAQTFERC